MSYADLFICALFDSIQKFVFSLILLDIQN